MKRLTLREINVNSTLIVLTDTHQVHLKGGEQRDVSASRAILD